ncbi:MULTISPECIES: hypothetical protein [unclassified Mycobacterium]|uniref:hypothetical protein n=1 Tax=unclassified Mycobacterium TaxID=2642494 RepID=UPI000A9F97FD|nr:MULTISPECIES: hypothetical protein [unclassified Mycobacterium]
MALDFDGPLEDTGQAGCPLRCRLRRAAAGDEGDQVDWAGLPINLDLAFSPQQRDKVYRQHLMRKRGTQLRRWSQDSGRSCACEFAADGRRVYPDGADSMSSS